jgi:hypothetical protein
MATPAPNPAGLTTSINSLYTGLSNANLPGVYEHQQEIKEMIQAESDRLDTKKKHVDNALDSQKRLISLNESARERYSAYTQIIVTIVVTLLIVVALLFLGKAFPFIPSFLIDILIALTVLVGGFIGYFMYVAIRQRNNIDYSRLQIDPPVTMTPAQIQENANKQAKLGDLLGSINVGGCIGAACCDVGTHWDEGNSICKPGSLPVVSGFQTLSISYKAGDLDRIAPNSPNEFENYVPCR